MTPRPKRSEVARLAGVAESTVSRALNDSPLITPAIKDRVKAAAAELGYIPSRQAAGFARSRTRTIGFVVPAYSSFPPFSRSYFPALLDGITLEADGSGYTAAIILDKQIETTDDYWSLIRSRTVDGLLFAVTRADFRPFAGLRGRGVPFVLINNYHDGLDSVDARPETGMRKALERAAAWGHARIGYITGDLRYRNAIDRLGAFETIAAETGMRAAIVTGDFSKTSGYAGAAALLNRADRPSLIMTASDRSAFGVLKCAAERDLRVPADLSVIGYDNLPPVQDISPSLSTIHQPVTELARAATALLIEILEGERHGPSQLWMETDFVERESTGPAREASSYSA